jgi:hypothetical protein
MPNNITINANLVANPSKETASKSQNNGNVTFNCAVACVLCFQNNSVFGVSSLSLPLGNNQDVLMTGSVGDSSAYRIYAAGTTCPAWRAELDDPFEITIGS